MRMEQLPVLLNVAGAVLWVSVTVALLRHPPALPLRLGKWLRRVVWGGVALAALAGSGWGPAVWQSTTLATARDQTAGPPSHSMTSFLRTPFTLIERITTVDAEGRTIQNERRYIFQVPIALLLFLAAGSWLVRRTRRRGDGDVAPAVSEPSPQALGSILVVLAVGLVACGDEADSGGPAERPDRRFVEVAWDTLAYVEWPEDEADIYAVRDVVADAYGIRVTDSYGYRIAHFDWDGRLLRHMGRQGGGPGEFASLMAVDLDRYGNVWVLDTYNNRVTGFDREGASLESVPLHTLSNSPHTFAVSSDGDSFFFMTTPDTIGTVVPIRLRREGGSIQEGRPIPVPDGVGAYSIVLQGAIAREHGAPQRSADEDRWVFAFTMGDGWFGLTGVEPSTPRVWYPEPTPFARAVRTVSVDGPRTSITTQITERRQGAATIVAQNGELWVLFVGETPDAWRLIDRYDLETGQYRDSFRLPRGGAIAVWEDRVLLAANNPVPQLLVLRPGF